MKYNHVMRSSCLAALICLSLSAVSLANGPVTDSAKASDPAFSVPVVSNPIPNEAIKDLEIVEDQGRWLVSDKALEQYGIREADHAKGTYWFRLPKARNGSTAWQNENVQLTLPGRAVSGGRTINIRHVRRPLGISYVLGNGTTEKNELLPPSQPVHTVPELREVQDAAPAAVKEGKMGTVLFWDPVMKEDANLPSLQTHQPVMSPCAFRLTENGIELRNPDFDMLASTYTSKGYAMWPLLDNNFNPKLTHQILSNSRLQDTMVRQLVGYALLYDFKGYNIDFENINYSDKDALTAFVAKISQACHAYGIKLSMDVTPLSDSPNWSLVYDRAALAPHLDYLMVMAYDQFGRSSAKAGPVASYPWVERAVQNTIDLVPPSKVLLGMPLYMRLWYESSDGRDLPKDIRDWPAVVGAPPMKGVKYGEAKTEAAETPALPMLVQVVTAEQENARRVKQPVIMPVELDGETYKRRVLPRHIKTAPKKLTTTPSTSSAHKGSGKSKLFVRTLTMADSEDILKAYKDYVVWNDDLQLYYLELPLTTGTVKIWFEDEKSLK
ncbi:MAG: glycosyl hydrolase family 18 protein, partial [Megasphaera elsdenii]|nr:glycosyl hydrolase family 18 protein [Megasphaera elsdenii]